MTLRDLAVLAAVALPLGMPLLYLGSLYGREIEVRHWRAREEALTSELERRAVEMTFVKTWCRERYAPYELCEGLE